MNSKNRSAMRSKSWLVVMSVVLALSLVVAGCSGGGSGSSSPSPSPSASPSAQPSESSAAPTDSGEQPTDSDGIPAPFLQDKPLRIALIRELTAGAWGEQYLAGAQAQAKELGVELLVSNAEGNVARHVSLVESAIRDKVDGLIIGHGKADALQPVVEQARAAGIPVVLDNLSMNLPDVPEVEQDDFMMAYQGLKKLVEDTNGEANLVYINVGGFPPMERRNKIYENILWRFPGIKEVTTFGNATASTMADTMTRMESVLRQHPKGTIDVVWAPWDEFAKGATEAIQQAGRTEIKVYSVDVTDADIQMMIRPDSPWVATAAADASAAGRVGVRAVAQLIAGEEVPKYLMVPPMLITQEFLLENNITNLVELGEKAPAFSNVNVAISPWMEALKERNAGK
jgi:ABC-type sugar transport system, periplasmic component